MLLFAAHPREQWKGYVPPYYPKFSNGFSVPPGWLESQEPSIIGDPRVRQVYVYIIAFYISSVFFLKCDLTQV